jgi:hypothetical protein
MQCVQLFHWNTAEAPDRAAQIHAVGYEVDAKALDGAVLRRLRDEPPDAVVIDLSRRPSQGRDLGLTLRKYVATRRVPLIFVDGTTDKVEAIREFLPDAHYTTWADIAPTLKEAIAHPPADPVVPGSVFDVYAGTPLAKKLGIMAGSTVALIDAPDGFEATLGDLPEGAVVRRGTPEPGDVTLWFVRAREALERHIGKMGDAARGGRLWVVWPKKSSGVKSDLSQPIVRRTGLDAGLVDFKVCSVDATWTGLCFSLRGK